MFEFSQDEEVKKKFKNISFVQVNIFKAARIFIDARIEGMFDFRASACRRLEYFSFFFGAYKISKMW